MDNRQDDHRSGYTSPDIPLTPATSNRLKRSASNETVATTVSVLSSTPSLNYPNAPRNTPATMSVAGDALEHAGASDRSFASLDTLTERLAIATPPSSPPTMASASNNRARRSTSTVKASPSTDTEEGKPQLRATPREGRTLGAQPSKPRPSPSPLATARPTPLSASLSKPPADREATPTRLSEVLTTGTAAASANHTPVFEYSAWALVAEEDVMRALARMAMLARDEHAKDPRYSVVQHYTSRLAKLIDEAEVQFDYGYVKQ